VFLWASLRRCPPARMRLLPNTPALADAFQTLEIGSLSSRFFDRDWSLYAHLLNSQNDDDVTKATKPRTPMGGAL